MQFSSIIPFLKGKALAVLSSTNTFAVHLVTDNNDKADIRAVIGIACFIYVFWLVSFIPSLLMASIDVSYLIGYGTVISILGGFGCAMFGIARESLR